MDDANNKHRFDRIDDRLDRVERTIFDTVDEDGVRHPGLLTDLYQAKADVTEALKALTDIREMMRGGIKWAGTAAVTVVVSSATAAGTVVWFFVNHAASITHAIGAYAGTK